MFSQDRLYRPGLKHSKDLIIRFYELDVGGIGNKLEAYKAHLSEFIPGGIHSVIVFAMMEYFENAIFEVFIEEREDPTFVGLAGYIHYNVETHQSLFPDKQIDTSHHEEIADLVEALVEEYLDALFERYEEERLEILDPRWECGKFGITIRLMDDW